MTNNMTSSAAAANESQMSVRSGTVLREHEQDRLIRAIEAAIEVRREDQFHAWLRGPFRMLLPHESAACIELDPHGGANQLVSLHHHLVDAVMMEFLDNPEHGLAVRLARAYRGNRRQSCTVDAAALGALVADGGGPGDRGQLHNAVIHRIKLLSGQVYCFVLVNVAKDHVDRCRQMFRLLSSHLKMALSCAIAGHEPEPAAALTARELEVLRWMGEGKSNREISAILDISALTLKNHVTKLYRKLDVQSREEAVARGLASQAGHPMARCESD